MHNEKLCRFWSIMLYVKILYKYQNWCRQMLVSNRNRKCADVVEVIGLFLDPLVAGAPEALRSLHRLNKSTTHPFHPQHAKDGESSLGVQRNHGPWTHRKSTAADPQHRVHRFREQQSSNCGFHWPNHLDWHAHYGFRSTSAKSRFYHWCEQKAIGSHPRSFNMVSTCVEYNGHSCFCCWNTCNYNQEKV